MSFKHINSMIYESAFFLGSLMKGAKTKGKSGLPQDCPPTYPQKTGMPFDLSSGGYHDSQKQNRTGPAGRKK